jgi:aminocarboxymuconate-semialdehyde decarboxylase
LVPTARSTPEKGPGYIRATIANLEEIGLDDDQRAAIFNGNAHRLLDL